MKTRIGIALVAMLALTAAPALATDGYFQLGYGTQQNGMAGAGGAPAPHPHGRERRAAAQHDGARDEPRGRRVGDGLRPEPGPLQPEPRVHGHGDALGLSGDVRPDAGHGEERDLGLPHARHRRELEAERQDDSR